MIKAAKQIAPTTWMRKPQTIRLMEILNKGGAQNALFVGGCVRNELMKKEVGDIDIATIFTPAQVTQLLQQENIKVIPTGIDHGTVTAVLDDCVFEITTLRRDVVTDGRYAEVEYTDDWLEDAHRRDFTINTLLADTDGNVYDPTGQGLEDLDKARVVFVGDAPARIAEDYLRILRFFRFYALYGSGAPDARALSACKEAAAHIADLSRERITQEFLKILSADNAAIVLQLMFENNVMNDIVDQDYKPEILQNIIAMQQRYNSNDIVTRLCVLQTDLENFEKYLVLSNAQKKKFAAYHEVARQTEKSVTLLAYRFGVDVSAQGLILHAAGSAETPDQELRQLQTIDIPVFPVNGQDLISAGIAQGPQLGEALKALENWWIEQGMSAEREACLKQLKQLPQIKQTL